MVLNLLSNLTIKNGDILAKIKSRKFCIKNHGYSKKMAFGGQYNRVLLYIIIIFIELCYHELYVN